MAFFASAITTLQTLVIALGAGLGVWGVVNLLELACDESVIKQFGDKSKSAYSLMLISMEAKKSGLSPLCSNFSKNAIEERITAIMNTKRTTITALLSACIIVFVTVSLFATSAMAQADNKANDTPVISERKTTTSDDITDKKSAMTIMTDFIPVNPHMVSKARSSLFFLL